MTGPLRREHAENSFAECVLVRRRRPRSRLARSSPPLRILASSEETGAAAGHDVHAPPSARTSTLRPSALLRKYRFASAAWSISSPRRTGMASIPIGSGRVEALLRLQCGQSQLGRHGSAAILIPARPYRRSSWPVRQPTRPERQPQAEGDRRERLTPNWLAEFRSRQFTRLDGWGITWLLRGREHLQLSSSVLSHHRALLARESFPRIRPAGHQEALLRADAVGAVRS